DHGWISQPRQPATVQDIFAGASSERIEAEITQPNSGKTSRKPERPANRPAENRQCRRNCRRVFRDEAQQDDRGRSKERWRNHRSTSRGLWLRCVIFEGGGR